jgi:hypothetical protein
MNDKIVQGELLGQNPVHNLTSLTSFFLDTVATKTSGIWFTSFHC